jgi:hypothetical protein
MAYINRPGSVTLRASPIFDQLFAAAEIAPYTGIYRCVGCGREGTCARGAPLPSADHHKHTPVQGAIRWQLAVAATHA